MSGCPGPSSPPPTLVVAYHGILTGLTNPTWPQRLEAWLMNWALRRPICLTEHYSAWPLPWLNWFLNRRHGKALATRVEMLRSPGDRLVMVAHSNGCCIVLDAIRRLAARGIRTDKAIFIAGAIAADPVKNGLADLAEKHWLGEAEAWWAPRDGVIGMPPPMTWPYGNLGRTGWNITDLPPHLGRHFPNVCFPDYGHGAWFDPDRREATFFEIARSLGIDLSETEE